MQVTSLSYTELNGQEPSTERVRNWPFRRGCFVSGSAKMETCGSMLVFLVLSLFSLQNKERNKTQRSFNSAGLITIINI